MIGRHNHICTRKVSNSFSGKSLLRNKNEIEMQTFHENALVDNAGFLIEKEEEKNHNEGSNIVNRFFLVIPPNQFYS